MKYTKTKDFIKSINLASRNKLYIAGAGKYGEILGKYFDKYRIAWEGYVDKKKGLSEINGKPVFSYGEMREGYYAISSYVYRNEIEAELAKQDIKSEQILIYEKQEIFYDIYNDLINWVDDTKKIKEFNDKHTGKRCFIIGNGPSLEISDLERLNNEITFASNSIYALYAHTNWRPTYYCATDSVFCKQMMSKKKNVIMLLNGCKAAFTSIMGEGICYKDDTDIKKLYYMRLLTKKLDNVFPDFSEDCSKQVYSSGTITYEMIQLAVYMGIKQIYLLGMDFSFSVERHNNRIIKNNVYNHMKEIEEEEKSLSKALSEKYGVTYLADMDLQLAGYQKAKQYADAHDIKIYNATRGGKLEVFPRVDFDSLFD